MSSKNIVFFDTPVKKKKGKTKNLVKESNKIPWVEKYRPRNVNDIIANDFLKVKIQQIIKNKSMPNLIITGSPGTGKDI